MPFFTSRREYYELAVKGAAAEYDVVSAPNPIFLRWVGEGDGEHRQNELAFWGRGFLSAAAAVYLLVSVVLGVACAMNESALYGRGFLYAAAAVFLLASVLLGAHMIQSAVGGVLYYTLVFSLSSCIISYHLPDHKVNQNI